MIGAGLGENARAALITRGIAEIARLAAALGGRAETVSGLSGLGDLLLTCTGISSRNYSLGLALGQGESLANILGRRSNVTEGVATAPGFAGASHRARRRYAADGRGHRAAGGGPKYRGNDGGADGARIARRMRKAAAF